MADLATSADVIARLGRALTTSEAAKIDALLADASASVRNYTHQYIEQVVNDTVTLQVHNGMVRLPQRPITAVTGLPWYGGDTIRVGFTNPLDAFAFEPYRFGTRAVAVTYTHGYDPIPDDIIGVVCSIVMRALGREPTDAGLTSESIAGYSYSLGSAAAAGGFGLLQAEKDVLDNYCRQGGVVQTAPLWIT
jgi:hypothetical protein